MSHPGAADHAAVLAVLDRLETNAGGLAVFAVAVQAALRPCVACDRVELVRSTRQHPQAPSAPWRAVVVLHRNRRSQVALVLSRDAGRFQEEELARLALLQPHLIFFYRIAARLDALPPSRAAPPLARGLTERERDVMRWLACGKTDAEIATLLALSPRTVHKHLEHIYVKLGVETRTAAVMRMLGYEPSGAALPAKPPLAAG